MSRLLLPLVFFRRHRIALLPISLAIAVTAVPARAEIDALRHTMTLDGTWQIAEGGMAAKPATFERTVPVPGLVDMAQPAFAEPGPKVADRKQAEQKDPRRDAFWYRRTFPLPGAVPAVARLKIGKAMFGTRVFLNGQLLGDHAPCFTPGYFDAKPALKSGENEILIRIGADRAAVGAAVPSGFDFEKDRYIPGIFDSVELIMSGTPRIDNVQVAPDIARKQARVRVALADSKKDCVTVAVREVKSGRVVGEAAMDVAAGGTEVNLVVPVADCHLWSPEDPFLYELRAMTSGDEVLTRFGMREFRFDPATGRAMLNGQPYPIRGSNITLYRFFEDPERGDLPWRESWVRLLHQRIKDMHWNWLRYCIGFPPESWYRIADEEGILIQDEFPIWFGGKGWSTWAKELKTPELAAEYTEWMRERWNHPCVVVWDANNETTSDETGPAIQQVRGLDLSGRPWDNSYMPPAQPGDVLEEHPYHFGGNGTFKLRQLATVNPAPWGEKGKGHGVVINEYGWLWLNRDGTPTTLTQKLYENLLGPNSTTEQRRHLYARYTAAETEFWRSHRTAAAVVHFTALGYSRPDGQTSDHWQNIQKLEWEPEFARYVRDAFAPVGLSIDAWAEDYPPGSAQDLPIVLINDLVIPWKGEVRLRILQGSSAVLEQTAQAEVESFGTKRLSFSSPIPQAPGAYQLEATLLKTPAGPVRSLRDFQVLTPEQREARRNLAAGRPATASSEVTRDGKTYPARLAVDGKADTRWSSEFSDPQWLAVDLGEPQTISRVELAWEAAFGKAYQIEISLDGKAWKSVYATAKGAGKTEVIRFEPSPARFVRLHGTQRNTAFGYSLFEFGVFH